jgi:serine/threonine protein kinase
MPSEQAAGNPKYNSDIYAVGMIAIQALTLTHPAHLPSDPRTGEMIWEDKAKVSPALIAILRKMVRDNFRERYQSTTEVLQALKSLSGTSSPQLSKRSQVKDKPPTNPSSLSEQEDSTQVWSDSSTAQDEEDSTQVWSDSSTAQDEDDSTQVWSDSSTAQDEDDSTQVWSDSSTLQDKND